MKFFTSLLLFLFVFFHSLSSHDKVLCVEIGHSRIKAGILPLNPSLQELRTIQTIESASQPWLGQNIGHLFSQNSSPLHSLLLSEPIVLSISIFGTEKYSKCPSGNIDDYPDNLEELMAASFNGPYSIERDTNAWALGALEYLSLQSKQPEYPCLAITLGTGIGIVLIENATTMKTIEYCTMPWIFPNLKPLTTNLVHEPVLVLGKNFLAQIFQGEMHIDEGMKQYREKYNSYFWAFVKDASLNIDQMFGCKIASVLVGGGNSRFIDALNTPLPLYLLNPQSLEKEGVSPDIIQLLGCVKKMREKDSKTSICSNF